MWLHHTLIAMDRPGGLAVIGRAHGEAAQWARTLARWSAGVVVATWPLRDIDVAHTGSGLFASLNADVREGLSCLAQIPIWLPAVLVFLALYNNYGAFYLAVRETLLGNGDRYRISGERGILVNSFIRELPTGWKRWHIFGWWIAAVAASAATTALAGLLLRTNGNAWLVWAPVGIVGWLVLTLESAITVRRYRAKIPPTPPDPEEAQHRAEEWRLMRPGDTSAMPLIYAHSGLTTDDVGDEFRKLGSSGPVGFTAKVLGLVIIVLIYSALPAPGMTQFRDDGLAGCLFSVVHGFAGVAEQNLGLSIVAGLILLALLPLSILYSYLRFMHRYHFPVQARVELLAREMGFALRSPIFTIIQLGILGLLFALLLWASAAVATKWDSPIAGTLVIAVPSFLFVFFLMRIKARGPN
jgi:hypothetical protein